MPKPTDPQARNYLFTDDIKFLQKCILLHPEDDQRFLVLKRSPNSFSRPNDWDFPGGNVCYGEQHDDSLRREVQEETGLTITDLAVAQIITRYDDTKPLYSIFAGFVTTAPSDIVVLSNEHTEYRWVTIGEFESLQPAEFLRTLASSVCA